MYTGSLVTLSQPKQKKPYRHKKSHLWGQRGVPSYLWSARCLVTGCSFSLVFTQPSTPSLDVRSKLYRHMGLADSAPAPLNGPHSLPDGPLHSWWLLTLKGYKRCPQNVEPWIQDGMLHPTQSCTKPPGSKTRSTHYQIWGENSKVSFFRNEHSTWSLFTCNMEHSGYLSICFL